jgi:hypothetical protein
MYANSGMVVTPNPESSGMVTCQRKGGNAIAIGRCMMMRKENKEPCEGCPYAKVKYDIEQKELSDQAKHGVIPWQKRHKMGR